MNVVLFNELLSEFGGISIGLPCQIGDQLAVAKIRGGIAMAFQTPAHAERRHGANFVHLVNAAVADHATHTLVDVGAVIEISELGQLVNSHPFDGHSAFMSFTDLGDFSGAGGRAARDQVVAIHANIGGGNSGMTAAFHVKVAVAAIDSQLSGVKLVAVSHRLDRLVAHRGIFRGCPIPDGENREAGEESEGNRKNCGNLVCPLGKYEWSFHLMPGKDKLTFSQLQSD